MSQEGSVVAKVLAIVMMAGMLIALPACQSRPRSQPLSGVIRPTADGGKRLLDLAASEAVNIPDPDVRLTRLLNLADMQTQRGWKHDATLTLGNAETTLRSAQAAELTEHARLSGWISVSELSRAADDTGRANSACDGAVKALLAIDDPGRRCEYVMGIGNELAYLKGNEAAGKLVDQAGPWTKSIDDLQRQRQAVLTFANVLFNLNDYEAGQRMLRNQGDAAWRSETLAQLAAQAGQKYGSPVAYSSLAPAAAEADSSAGRIESRSSSVLSSFGRPLGYRQVFQNQTHSQTLPDKPSKSGK